MNSVNPLRRFFGPPMFADEEQQRIARTLFVIQITLLIGAGVILLISLLIGDWLTAYGLMVSGAVGLLSLVLGRSGRLRLAGFLILMALLMFLTYALYVGQGVHDIGILLYPVIIIVASLLLMRRGFVVLMALMLASLGAVVYGEMHQLVPAAFPDATGLSDFATGATIMIMAAVAIRLMSDDLLRSLALTQRNEHALAESHQQLQQQADALRRAEEKYRSLVENAMEGFFQSTPDGRFLSVNSAMARMYGYASPADMLACVTDIQTQIYLDPAARAAMQHQLETEGKIHDYETLERRKDGGTIWVSTNVQVVRDEQGTVLRYEGTLQDITQRKQAELALRQNEAILAVVARMARLLLETTDWRQQIHTALEQLGEASRATHVYVFENHLRADGELLASQRYEWVMPGFRPEIDDPRLQNMLVHQSELDDWYDLLLRGEPFYSSSRDFSEQWSESLTQRGIKTLLDVPIFANGQWWGIIGFDDCVNELAWSEGQINALLAAAGILGAAIQRQQIEAQLREREERYRLISEVISDYTFSTMIDAQGAMQLNWVAGAFEKITGYSFDEYVSRGGWLAALYPDDVAQDARDMAALRVNRAAITEVRTISHNGAVRWVRVYAHPVWNEIETRLVGIYGAVQDVTERKQAEAERETLIHELEARNSELERFTYTVSHDLKSPLITVRGFLGFVEQDARAGNFDRMTVDLARIVEATDKMRRLLDELLELSRIGRLMNPPEAVPFEAIIQEALRLVQGRIEARGVQVTIAPALPVVHGDRVRLIEVIQNLVDNACKFMGDQAEPQITIGQRGTDRDGKPIVFVQDNGLGIDPRYHEKVFELFDKLDAKGEGTGVGLALVKRIVEVHGGKIWVESEGAGKGSKFLFTLPGGSA